VDSEPHSAEKCKAIRDKKERFIQPRKVAERGGMVAAVSRVKAATGV
jgi:hypothetical protein